MCQLTVADAFVLTLVYFWIRYVKSGQIEHHRYSILVLYSLVKIGKNLSPTKKRVCELVFILYINDLVTGLFSGQMS